MKKRSDKTGNPSSTHGPISKKILAQVQKVSTSKVVDLSQFKAGKRIAESLQETVVSQKDLANLDPLHAVYVYSINQLSVFVEQLGTLADTAKLVKACLDAEDVYMPSGPPTSPLTQSYFNHWAFFDLCVGPKKETWATIAIDVCKMMKVHKDLVRVFEIMQCSRMGFYVHQGFSGGHQLFRELVTNKVIRAIFPSGYKGSKDEICYLRVMPGSLGWMDFGYDVVVTTPYVISEMLDKKFVYAKEEKWLGFFDRTLKETEITDNVAAYEYLMKYGLGRHYWNEYVFEGYVNYEKEMILLAGFPDIASSRPHSNVNEILW